MGSLKQATRTNSVLQTLRITSLTVGALVKTDNARALVSDTTQYLVGDGVRKVTVGPTEPINPDVGDIWIEIP